MTNNSIKNHIQLERTNLIRGGTDYPYAPFELKLQLHGKVSNPYAVSVKRNYKTSTNIFSIPNTPDRVYNVPTQTQAFTLTIPDNVYIIRAASSIESYGAYVGASIYNTKSGYYWVQNTTSNGDIDIEKFIGVVPGATYSLYMLYEGTNGGSWLNRLATLKSGTQYNNKKIDYYDNDYQ